MKQNGVECAALLNWSDQPAEREIPLTGKSTLTETWTDADLGTHQGTFKVTLPPHSGRMIKIAPEKQRESGLT